MTDSVKLPQLHLFNSHRNTRSPTRDFVQYHEYKQSRKYVPSGYQSLTSRAASPPRFSSIGNTRLRQYSPIRQPILIPNPVPIPMQPLSLRRIPYQPIFVPPQPIILSRPISMPAPIPIPVPISPIGVRQFIRAPSTYLQYAEEYLLGQPLPLATGRESQTARFMGRAIDSSRNSICGKYRYGKCDCHNEHHGHTGHTNISKNTYLGQKKQPKSTPQKPYTPQPQPKIVVTPPSNPNTNNSNNNNSKAPNRNSYTHEANIQIKPTPSPSPPSRDPYIQINSQREQNIHNTHSHQTFNLTQIHQNKSIIINQPAVAPVPPVPIVSPIAPARPPVPQSSAETQTDPSAPNRSSLSISTLMRSMPNTLDSQSFRLLLQKRLQQFNSIKIQFEDLPIIDLQDLIDTKEQYIDYSRELLVQLNKLAADRVQYNLVYGILQQKKKSGILWPNI